MDTMEEDPISNTTLATQQYPFVHLVFASCILGIIVDLIFILAILKQKDLKTYQRLFFNWCSQHSIYLLSESALDHLVYHNEVLYKTPWFHCIYANLKESNQLCILVFTLLLSAEKLSAKISIAIVYILVILYSAAQVALCLVNLNFRFWLGSIVIVLLGLLLIVNVIFEDLKLCWTKDKTHDEEGNFRINFGRIVVYNWLLCMCASLLIRLFLVTNMLIWSAVHISLYLVNLYVLVYVLYSVNQVRECITGLFKKKAWCKVEAPN